jgi:glycosyltransferase involved in cell wall biosynthesis
MPGYGLMAEFSGIVVTFNEASRLSACLESLSFCAERIVFDLGSTDETVNVARRAGARVISHPRVLVVEEIRAKAMEAAANDWIVFLDPDEVFPQHRVSELRRLISRDPLIAMIGIPLQFYFKCRPLTVTIWGEVSKKYRVIHRRRTELPLGVHGLPAPFAGYRAVALPAGPIADSIQHYWIDSYRQLFSKHWRYIRKEGEARYKRGERFRILHACAEVWRGVRMNLTDFHGARGGFVGVFLSFFYGLYVGGAHISLGLYQWSMRRRLSKGLGV